MPENILYSFRTELPDENLLDPHAVPFQADRQVLVDRLWNGRLPQVSDRPTSMTVASLWNKDALYFYFACSFDELHVNPDFGEGGPCNELWEFDVVEAFIRPEGAGGYFEVEVSPLAQWLDLYVIKPRQEVDWHWRSQLTTRTSVDRDSHLWLTALRLPFRPMLERAGVSSRLEAGTTWRINLFRAAGFPPSRLHFSWRPTLSPEPDFHVPRAFGVLLFMDEELASS